jgi:TolB protein
MGFKKTLASLLVGGAVLFGGLSNKVLATPFIEVPITTNSYSQERPAIHDGKIVWQDMRNGSWDIYSWDSTNGVNPLIANLHSQTNPSISRGNVVWQDDRNGNSDIYLWTPFDGEVRVSTKTNNDYSPDISGLNITWAEQQGSGRSIIAWTPSSHYFEVGAGITGTPRISGNHLVYHRKLTYWYIHEGWTNKREEGVAGDSSPLMNPDISNEKMVWETNNGIYFRDLDGISGYISSTNTAHNPKIDGERVVWEDNRNGNWDVYMWDKENGERQVTSNPFDQRLPSIHGEDIVWQDMRNGNWDIYSTTIPEPSTLALMGLGVGLLTKRKKK